MASSSSSGKGLKEGNQSPEKLTGMKNPRDVDLSDTERVPWNQGHEDDSDPEIRIARKLFYSKNYKDCRSVKDPSAAGIKKPEEKNSRSGKGYGLRKQKLVNYKKLTRPFP